MSPRGTLVLSVGLVLYLLFLAIGGYLGHRRTRPNAAPPEESEIDPAPWEVLSAELAAADAQERAAIEAEERERTYGIGGAA